MTAYVYLQAEKEEQGAIEKAPVKDESQDQWAPPEIPLQPAPTQEVTDWASEAMPVAPAPQPFMPAGTAKDWSATTDDWSAAASGPAPTTGAPEWGGTAAENWSQIVKLTFKLHEDVFHLFKIKTGKIQSFIFFGQIMKNLMIARKVFILDTCILYYCTNIDLKF